MSDASRLPPSPAGKADLAVRAATLFERLAQAPASSPVEPSRDARLLVELWQRTYSPGSWIAFTNRLSWDGLTADTVIAALSATSEGLPADGAGSWIHWIQRFIDECRTDAGARTHLTLFPDPETTPRFVEALLPAWTLAARELHARVPGDVASHFDAGAMAALGRRLVQDLSAQAAQALEARSGDDIAAVLNDHPVLARHVALILEQWLITTQELMGRFARDRSTIGSTFFHGEDPGTVIDIEPAMSDPHHGRRRVARLAFAGGRRLIYKPRDIGIEAAFAAFLDELRGRGLADAPPSVVTLPRNGYGWVANVTPGTPDDSTEWYRRAGALLCVAHVLRGRDLHMENVVATAAGPVVVDAELLIQPVTQKEQQARRTAAQLHPAFAPLELRRGMSEAQPSCLATGFVSDIHTSGDGTLIDVGGLRGSMPASHRQDFIDGFDAAYGFFQQHRPALLASGGPLDRFAGQWTRVIGRPTDQYASLLALLAAPKYQQSGAQRSTAIDALNRAFSLSELRPALWSLTADERRSLERLDIPLFHAAADQPHVFCEGRQVLADHFAQPGLDAVRERLQGLGDADRAHQVKILRRSTRESVDSRFTSEPVIPSAEGATPALGTRVVGHALWIAEECLTLGAEPSDDRGRSAAGFVLYDGELGPALFYAAVAATAGSEQAASAAREILERFTRSDAFEAGDRPLGACTGDGSLIYALSCIAGLLDDEMPIELASRVARTITPARAYTDEHLDVSSGAAGAIFGLLALHARTGEKDLLQRAASCGERLLATRITSENGAAWRAADGRLYVGFAHGAAGIGLALVRLSQATGRQDFLDAAGAAHRFERRAYLPEARNWPIAAADAGGGVEMMTAWCHGAPGLALARTRAAVALSDRSLLNGVEQALKTTAAVPVRLDDHMCCGSMGRCDVLLTSGLALAADQAVTAAWTLAGQVVDRAERERRYRLTSRGHQMRVFDTGFFRGLSGIGYQLLRLAAPSRLPSVLSFDPPSQRPRS